MKLTTISVVLGFTAASAHACECSHNADAGRWVDDNSPGAAALVLANGGGGCEEATVQGNMCIQFSNAEKGIQDCIAQYAVNQQSYHGDWFLWTSIQCSDGGNEGTLTITG